MVVPKGAVKKKPLEEEKSGSPSPEPFQEPEGMTTIDLNKSDDYSKECDEGSGKIRQRAQIRYVARLLACLCSILLLVMVVLISGAFLDREYQLFTISTTTQPPLTSTTENFIILTKQLNQALFKDMLKSSNYINNSPLKMQRCQLKRTLEACCHVFKHTELHLFADYCTVNDMLNILMEFEAGNRRKREIDLDDYFLVNSENDGESDYLLQAVYPEQPLLEEEQLVYDNLHHELPERNSPVVGAPLPERIKEEVLHHVSVQPTRDLSPVNGVEHLDIEFRQNEHPRFVNWREEDSFQRHQLEKSQKGDFMPTFENGDEIMTEQRNHEGIVPERELGSPVVGSYLGAPLPERVKEEVLHHVTIEPTRDLSPFEGVEFQQKGDLRFKNWTGEDSFQNQQLEESQKDNFMPTFENGVEIMAEQLNHEGVDQGGELASPVVGSYLEAPLPERVKEEVLHHVTIEPTRDLFPLEGVEFHHKEDARFKNWTGESSFQSQQLEESQKDNFMPTFENSVEIMAKQLNHESVDQGGELASPVERSYLGAPLPEPVKEERLHHVTVEPMGDWSPSEEIEHFGVEFQQKEHPRFKNWTEEDGFQSQQHEESQRSNIMPAFESDAEIMADQLEHEGVDLVRNTKNLLVGSSNLFDSNLEEPRASASQDNEFRPKGKQLGALEDIQSTQQMLPNPCFYPYPSPYIPMMPNPSRVDPGYLKVLPTSQPRAQVLLNPAMFYNVPQPTSTSYLYPQLAQSVQPPAQAPLQVSSPGGQYYMCNPISTPGSNIAGLAQVEVRREAASLQDLLLEDAELIEKNQYRAAWESIKCPLGERPCLDNSKCIKNQHVCDNEVHCEDGSDEMGCSCKDRVGKLRLCDGYCDCPRCEDEDACFGCREDEFSCDDWSRFRRSTCIPLEQRCDGVKQCEITGRDETDCSVLADQLGNLTRHKVSNSVGFLHRNYKGQWYPTCFGSELWAAEVCQVEAGPSSITPKTHMSLTAQKYDGKFINVLPNNEVSLVRGCVQDRAAFVQCPPIYCGLRFVVHNPYRREEVDTSLEEVLNELERAYSMREDDSLVAAKLGDILEETQADETLSKLKKRHAEGRVVGGKPSQPSAWPWLVSIYKNGIFHCAGVLINELWVVTASHCVDRYWQYYYEIQAGTLRRFSYSPMDQRRWAKKVISHELYDKENLRNDIALMELSAPIRYNRHVRPICLPSESTAGIDFKKEPTAGTICTTVGWGATMERGSDPDQMREVEIPIIGHCKHKEDSDFEEICAGLSEGGKDACQGDSGGPLMCRNTNNPNQWYLAGIVSHGQGCARPNEPGVYTRVSKYIPWIVEHTRDARLTMAHTLQTCPGYICKGIRRCISKNRRCDGTVDCLLGDDEFGCELHNNNIFKHSRSHLMRPLDEEDVFEGLLGAKRNSSKNLWGGFDGINFRCKILLQVIPMKKRCDKHLDCEDGSDEAECSCAHYVQAARPDAICDGITDCQDVSDEIGCAGCSQSQFTCRLSQQCIDQAKRCDGKSDCPHNEDELNCVALSNGRRLTVDKDNRPILHVKGLVTVNHQGSWRPLCVNSSIENSVVASGVCSVLGFQDYNAFYRYSVENTTVDVTKSLMEGRVTLNEESVRGCQHCCNGLFVSCANKSVSTTLTFKNLEEAHELYFSPWTASIYSDGIFQCTAALLNPSWVITSIYCFGDDLAKYLGNHTYVTAVLGKGKLDLPVKGPHEQLAQVIRGVTIQKDVLLLQLDQEVKLNRYVQTADLNSRWEGATREKCFASGFGAKGIEFKALYPKEKCPRGFRCFDRKFSGGCNDTQQSWTGVVMCDSRVGWYPAAVFHEVLGKCGFAPDKSYTSLQFLKSEILDIVSGKHSNASHIVLGAAHCRGFRCPLGQCLSKQQECDGVRDCQDGSDESEEVCYRKESECYQSNRCDCPATHFKCPKSKKCVLKSAFCDGNNDCGDYADEPTVCSCGNYLDLTNPERVCDRILNCADRTDEDPELCKCKPEEFHCGTTNKCVANDTLCDGYRDCPDGEDEAHCFKLVSRNHKEPEAGEVQTRTAGVWHPGCFNSTYSSEDLDEMCVKLGFPAGTLGYQLPGKPNVLTPLPERPVIDVFDVVWLNSAPKRRLKFLLRPGNRPYVNFVKDSSCHRLFIACF